MQKLPENLAFYQMIATVYRVAVIVCDETETIQTRISPYNQEDERLFSLTTYTERLFQLCQQTMKPQVISSEFNQVWAGVPVIDHDKLSQLIVIGPIYTSEVSEELIIGYARANNLSTQSRERLLSAFKQTPIYSFVEFTRLISQIYYFHYQKEMEISFLSTAGVPKEVLMFSSEAHISQREVVYDEGFVHSSYAFEQYMWECVREGKLDKLKRHLFESGTFGSIGPIAQKDPIRQHKNAVIIAVGLAVRSAIAGGLNQEIAYSLGDLYIQQIETLNDVMEILVFAEHMLYDFTTRVGNLKDTHRYSSLVQTCCNYIKENVRKKLLVSDVAAHSGLSAYYVSKKFKAETGLSISEYIREEKISEAKSLLKYSQLSLSEISELFSFTTQSHFTSTFKQMTGTTPRKYRETAGGI
ncbi:MAG: helix-turn-helix domain-containing protein [Anaerolineaceae bacterium]|nr:helix-turn-helix domain-containing protein [Anaerolineaceae bacterium]